MLKDLEEVRECCLVNDREAEALSSAAAPIVLLRTHDSPLITSPISPRSLPA